MTLIGQTTFAKTYYADDYKLLVQYMESATPYRLYFQPREGSINCLSRESFGRPKRNCRRCLELYASLVNVRYSERIKFQSSRLVTNDSGCYLYVHTKDYFLQTCVNNPGHYLSHKYKLY